MCSVLETRTFGERQANPAYDEATVEMTMSNNHDVSGSLTLLFPFPMILTNLCGLKSTKRLTSYRQCRATHFGNNTVDASCHLFN